MLSAEHNVLESNLITHTLRCTPRTMLQRGAQEYCPNVHSTINVYMPITWLKCMGFSLGGMADIWVMVCVFLRTKLGSRKRYGLLRFTEVSDMRGLTVLGLGP